MSGCVGSEACKCTQYVQVAKTNDCYTCGHVAKDHKGLGRVAVEGDLWNESSCYRVFQGRVSVLRSLSFISFKFSIFDNFKCYKKCNLKSTCPQDKSRYWSYFSIL